MARGKGQGGRYSPGRGSAGGEEDEGTDRWLATYADAVTLLMAFFILLYAMSEIDVSKFAAFVQGLEVPFGNVSAEGMAPASDGLLPERDGLQPDNAPPAELEAQAPPPAQVAAAEDAVEEAREERIQDQLEEVRAALNESLREEGLDELVEQRIEERGLRVSIASDDILFALGSTEIDDLGRRVIRTVARTLDDFPNPLTVEGHTDDTPLTRAGYTNWNLSTDRAVEVLSLMVERHGLPPDRVGAVGYGEFRPLADNDTSAGRARNRRVDIVVLVTEELQ